MYMKKHKGGGILFLILEIIGLLILVAGGYIYLRINNPALLDKLSTFGNYIKSEEVVKSGNCGLVVTSPIPKSSVTFPLVIKGVVDNSDREKLGCSWQMFEGQAGTAEIYFKDGNNEWKKLGTTVPVPVENWMSVKTFFSVSLNFNNEGIGLPTGTPMKVVFTEENASGIPPVDTYELPLVLSISTKSGSGSANINANAGASASTSSELMPLTLYIQNKEIAKTSDCGVTKKVIYQVPKTTAIADASLKILFSSNAGAGELSQYGVYKSVSISNSVAKVLLASENQPSGTPISSLSSCQSSHLMSVLRDTLTQYNTIKSVEIYSPKGKIMF